MSAGAPDRALHSHLASNSTPGFLPWDRAAYSRHVGGRKLTFESPGDGHFRDRETGSTWNILGEAVDGELKGTHLDPVQHGNHFWFAWAVFRPDTKVIQ